MAFIRKADYSTQIQTDDLNTITETNDGLLDECEAIAIEEIKSYISRRYDVEQIFAPVLIWNNGTTYDVEMGFQPYYEPNNKTYIPTAISSNQNPVDFPNLWSQVEEPRNPKIIMCCVDLALYHLHSRINPRNIPEIRGLRRDDCVKWLEGVRDGKNNPSLPNNEDENGNVVGLGVSWGSSEKRNNRY